MAQPCLPNCRVSRERLCCVLLQQLSCLRTGKMPPFRLAQLDGPSPLWDLERTRARAAASACHECGHSALKWRSKRHCFAVGQQTSNLSNGHNSLHISASLHETITAYTFGCMRGPMKRQGTLVPERLWGVQPCRLPRLNTESTLLDTFVGLRLCL